MAKKAVEHTFTKSQLVGAKRFADHRDILRSQLKKDGTYTIAQCEEIIENFLHPAKEEEPATEEEEGKGAE